MSCYQVEGERVRSLWDLAGAKGIPAIPATPASAKSDLDSSPRGGGHIDAGVAGVEGMERRTLAAA